MSRSSPFLEFIRKEIRLRGYSMRTEKTYLYWLRHFIIFNRCQSGEFVTCWRFDPLKTHSRSVFVLDIDSIEKQHMKMHVEIDRPAETLNQGDCASVSRGVCVPRFYLYAWRWHDRRCRGLYP